MLSPSGGFQIWLIRNPQTLDLRVLSWTEGSVEGKAVIGFHLGVALSRSFKVRPDKAVIELFELA